MVPHVIKGYAVRGYVSRVSHIYSISLARCPQRLPHARTVSQKADSGECPYRSAPCPASSCPPASSCSPFIGTLTFGKSICRLASWKDHGREAGIMGGSSMGRTRLETSQIGQTRSGHEGRSSVRISSQKSYISSHSWSNRWPAHAAIRHATAPRSIAPEQPSGQWYSHVVIVM